MTERSGKDIDYESNEGPQERSSEDTDQAGEVHMDASPDREIELEDRKARGGTDTSECDLVGFDTTLTDAIRDGCK